MKETVLLTGATSGIGESIAIELSKEYDLVISGRNSEKLESCRKVCIKNGNKVSILNLDLTDLNLMEKKLSNFLIQENIIIDKFVHCAGFMKMIPLKLISQEMIFQTFCTNVFSANLIIKILNNRKLNMSALNNVVLISSNISNYGAKAMSVYGSSKSALDGMMRGLAVELAPKIRVNSVLPGAVETEMTKMIFENETVSARMNQDYPLGIGKPNYISDAVLFLLSHKSSWITGQQITVDGGRSINISS